MISPVACLMNPALALGISKGLIGSPVFSDYEGLIDGNLSVTGLQTCWTGVLRNHVGGSVTDRNNRFGDPDAGEVAPTGSRAT